MSWIKRNLFFVIGGVVALALMGCGGYYLYTQIQRDDSVTEEIKKQYAELDRLSKLNPHPGDAKTDNIKAAKEQQDQLRAYIAKIQPFFQPIAPIPNEPKVSNMDFASELRTTVQDLRQQAAASSVTLATNYYFSFEAQKTLMNFQPASLSVLSTNLGEVKAICEILFRANINSLDSIQRELISADDTAAGDYLPERTVSTPLASLTPYRVTFHSFSTELAAVLGGLASSPHGLLVKTINVEPTVVEQSDAASLPAASTVPVATGQQMSAQQFALRYGRLPGAGYPQPFATAGAAPRKSGVAPYLDQKILKITLLVEVVKLKPVK
ncbi:MAG TPA: Amuc_1100 family pilus-like protein [Verrucomicrobiae bacterium]|jgi:hypothetical protein|nr:Amuc_1100 family pilus-like protein [Verrucomicrobiae bacterium]